MSERCCSQLWKFTGWQGESKNNRTIKWPNTSQGLLSGKVSERENEVLLGFWFPWFSGHMWSEENGALGGRSGGRLGERGYLFHRQTHSWPAWPVWLHTRQKVCNAFWQRGRKTQRQTHLITELLPKAVGSAFYCKGCYSFLNTATILKIFLEKMHFWTTRAVLVKIKMQKLKCEIVLFSRASLLRERSRTNLNASMFMLL